MMKFHRLLMIIGSLGLAILPATSVNAADTCKHRFFSDVTTDALKELLDVMENTDICSEGQTFKIALQSYGGDPDAMIFAYKEMMARGNIETKVMYCAASAAVILFLAGEERVMDVDATLYLHNITTSLNGDFSEADLLEEIDSQQITVRDYVAIIADRTGLSKQKVIGLMDARTTLSAKDALRLGFATKIRDDKTASN